MKRATQQFIEDAIAGGAISEYPTLADKDDALGRAVVCRILLDPLAWQAVGKTRGWKTSAGEVVSKYDDYGGLISLQEWHENWISLIDHLADGKSVEEALSALT